MNASELAEKLLDCLSSEDRLEIRSASAQMLRQQQAEIEALKAAKIRAYNNGVEDGRKPNTNLVKELTDEEIANTWDDVRKDATLKSSMKDIQDFARAILRKAQEKCTK